MRGDDQHQNHGANLSLDKDMLQANACSHRATVPPPSPGLHPYRRTSPPRHGSCASILSLSATTSALPSASICFNAAIISASVRLPFDIPLPLSFVRNHTRTSSKSGEHVNHNGSPDVNHAGRILHYCRARAIRYVEFQVPACNIPIWGIVSGFPTTRSEYNARERLFSVQLVSPRTVPRRCLGCQECQPKSKIGQKVRHRLVILIRFWYHLINEFIHSRLRPVARVPGVLACTDEWSKPWLSVGLPCNPGRWGKDR